MKSHLDFEDHKDYEKYLIVYFSGQIIASLIIKYGGCSNTSDDVSKAAVTIAKDLVKQLAPVFYK